MDVFGTVVTSVTLIYNFVDACAAFSSQAQSLAVRFSVDLTSLEKVKEFLRSINENPNHELSNDAKRLLRLTEEHLNSLTIKTSRNLEAIQRVGYFNRAALGITWIVRRTNLQELQKELRDWTDTFGVKLVDLPPEFRYAVQITPQSEQSIPPEVKSNQKLHEFADLLRRANSATWAETAESMLRKDSGELEEEITNSHNLLTTPVVLHGQQFVLATRKVPFEVVEGDLTFKEIERDVGILAAALNCLDPAADVRLLKAEFYFYHANSRQFLLAHYPPYATASMVTLHQRIRADSPPYGKLPLNQQLRLAHKIAEAVFFLHASQYMHKNITPSSIVIFRRQPELETGQSGSQSLSCLDEAYLMGFDLIRAADSRTTRQGAIRGANSEVRPVWEFDVYQHPKRQLGEASLKYTKAFDVYSLGVVLLQIGIWKSLDGIATGMDVDNAESWPEYFAKLADTKLRPVLGEAYQRAVVWCLRLSADDGMREVDFVDNLLDPLAKMVDALS